METPRNPGRFSDGVNDGYVSCSTGFGVTIGGVSRLTTAGHCFPNGDPVNNGLNDHSNPATGCCFIGSRADMGVVFGNQTSCCDATGKVTGDVDSEDLTAPPYGGSDLVWRGDIGASYRATISGRSGNPEGSTVCNLGAYSGEVCSTVTSTQNVCLTYTVGTSTYRTCHTYLADQTAGGIANEEGDSGGPVIKVIGGLVYGTGTVTAQDTGPGLTVPCVHYNPAVCSRHLWITGLFYILNDSAAVLNTG